MIENAVSWFSGWVWGVPLLILVMGGGLYFLVYSRFLPFQYLRHAVNVLRGKYDESEDEGQISHYEALSTAIAATVGMGNISGVAVAITMGGPGAIFWMWVSAFFGMATKFFTCTLAVMYRGKDSAGEVRGGPMYVITEGMGKKWKPLAIFFCVVTLVGALPIFQANQLTQALNAALDFGGGQGSTNVNYVIGFFLAALVSLVVFGGIKRIGSIASKMVPSMVVLYFVLVLYILIINIETVPGIFSMIFSEAFSGNAILGGGVGAIILVGAKRAAFSNEAGIGTAPMVHGDTKTDEPVREGLVAMLGPAIDTLIVCTLTALVILGTGVYEGQIGAGDTSFIKGVTLTLEAFNTAIPGVGGYLLCLCVVVFALSTMFSYSYYGVKSMSYMLGAKYGNVYNYIYIVAIVLGAVSSLGLVVNLIDGSFALMAIPTMISALVLAPKAMKAARDYFKRVDAHELHDEIK